MAASEAKIPNLDPFGPSIFRAFVIPCLSFGHSQGGHRLLVFLSRKDETSFWGLFSLVYPGDGLSQRHVRLQLHFSIYPVLAWSFKSCSDMLALRVCFSHSWG